LVGSSNLSGVTNKKAHRESGGLFYWLVPESKENSKAEGGSSRKVAGGYFSVSRRRARRARARSARSNLSGVTNKKAHRESGGLFYWLVPESKENSKAEGGSSTK
jgi:hypothetical protein